MARRTRTKVLVFDESPEDPDFYGRALAAQGFDVTLVGTPEAARGQRRPDLGLALVVVGRQPSSGLRVIRALRRAGVSPIVAALPEVDESSAGAAIRAGACLCLALPLRSPKALAQSLLLALSAREPSPGETLTSEQMAGAGMVDAVSGAYGAKFLPLRLSEEIARARRYGRPLSILLMDIDQYRDFTKENGERLADLLVRQVVSLVRWGVRPSDCICRSSVDQFAVILAETPMDGAIAAAEKIRRSIEEAEFMRKPASRMIGVTVSIGCAEYSRQVDSAGDLLRSAEAALYEAKVRGKNTVRW